MILAAFAGMVLVLAGCTQNNQLATTSPEATPSVATTPSTVPTATPTDTPSPESSPPPVASPSPAKLIITSVNFHMGEVGLTYGTVTAGAAGGVKPYKWSISSGALPSGLALSKGGGTTGKPTAPGTFSFVIRVDDSAGGAAGVSRSIFVFRQIAFTSARGTCSGNVNTGCVTQLKYVGGASSASPKVNVTENPSLYPPLPTGSTFTAKAGVVSVSIAAPFCTNNNYDPVIVTVVLVDQSPCGASFNCTSVKLTLTINLVNSC